MRTFFFHYNKPASKSAGHPVLTVHVGGRCILVRRIVCNVPVTTRERKTQPHVVMTGKGVVRLHNEDINTVVATITAA